MKLSDRQLFGEALDHLAKAKWNGLSDLTQDLVLDVIAMRLVAMIDVLSRLPDDALRECFGDMEPHAWDA